VAWDPETYPSTIRLEIPDYDRLQAEVAEATRDTSPECILDLGIGSGETARRVLQIHEGARLVGTDSSAAMLAGARRVLPPGRVTLLRQDLAAPLPDRRFDLVVSALAVHHLEGDRKAVLFDRVVRALVPGGRFVMGDVIVPEDPADALIENEPGYDFPSPLTDQLRWLERAGLSPEVVWLHRDLGVVRAQLKED
jgi:tRNA (cmo5U34)-methyltransferase